MLKAGDTIPSFELPDEEGKLRRIGDFLGEGKLVIYFYPMDFTPGCTKEACSFRDRYDAFRRYNATVVGVSADSPERHRKFKEKHRLPFTLLSDKGNKVRKMFGIKKLLGIMPARVTFIADAEGRIIQVFDSLFEYEAHVERSLRSAQ